jgi:hypothetical protein
MQEALWADRFEPRKEVGLPCVGLFFETRPLPEEQDAFHAPEMRVPRVG